MFFPVEHSAPRQTLTNEARSWVQPQMRPVKYAASSGRGADRSRLQRYVQDGACGASSVDTRDEVWSHQDSVETLSAWLVSYFEFLEIHASRGNFVSRRPTRVPPRRASCARAA